jgi:chromosome segregation protein
VHLKTLTLRGFKSFASATTLRFEPGITCVVGPNGSGKSNVVDALAWVMGEQGVKPLRGGKMDDVVFAGTAGRPALGRAEVSLTIDNSDGALPIEYAEVTISRLLFRSGQSEYAINGEQCRLLDIQELLSDTGLGREMHVIVGQDQLGDILQASPDARRSMIEEAAGVLKHRRRKEKALRKLEAMQANLTRLIDLTDELRRRLKPLGRQAEIARRAAVIQADLRDAKLRLLADDYACLAAELEQDEAVEAAAAARRTAAEQDLARSRAAEAELEEAEQQDAPRLQAAQDTYFTLAGLAERLRGMFRLAEERARHLSAPPEQARPGRDPGELEAEAGSAREQERELREQLAAARARLSGAIAQRAAAEAALAEAEKAIAATARAALSRAERLARLRAEVGAARSRAGATQEEAARLATALEQAQDRRATAQREYATLQDQVRDGEESRAALAAAHERAQAALTAASDRMTAARKAEHAASEERAGLAARAETLAEAVRQGSDAGDLLFSDGQGVPGVVGPLASLIKVADGAARAIDAALGWAAGAVVVSSLDAAAAVLDRIADQEASHAELVIASGESSARTGPGRLTGDGGRVQPAIDLIEAPSELREALDRLLGGVFVVPDLAAGVELVRANRDASAVTRAGELIGAHWARGGAGGPGLLGLREAAAQAARELAVAERNQQRAERELADAAEEEDQARQAVTEALAGLREADAAAAQVSGRLGALAGAARAAQQEAERLARALAAAERARDGDLGRLAGLQARLAKEEAQAGASGGADGGDDHDKGALAEAATAARAAEMDARLEVRTVEERLRAVAGRGEALAAAAAAERQAIVRARARAERRTAQAGIARAVAEGAAAALAAAERSQSLAAAELQSAQQASSTREEQLKDLRARIRELSGQLDTLVDSAHGAEIAREGHRMRLEQLATRATEEFGVDVASLLAEYGPDVGVPAGDPGSEPVRYDRAAQEQRAASAQRLLDQLGKVNPLALEEYAALEERHAFLAAQLEDLRKTRRDLLTVIKEVDDRVQQVFTAAYEDTAREFEAVFARLFPGGQGRLVLTEPDDMLATGIDFEARPPGKKVRRLSLLSGGERALTAIAFLLAIFRARPSPFYVLDEVEAALDDINLQRLLEIFAELQENSQLIVVTHQKRTMEIADTLYGISMRGDGVSAVVSQRLREPATA